MTDDFEADGEGADTAATVHDAHSGGAWRWCGPAGAEGIGTAETPDDAGWLVDDDAAPYHLVVVPVTGRAECTSHATSSGLCAAVVAACRGPSTMQAFAFGPNGARLRFWHGPAPGAVGAPHWGLAALDGGEGVVPLSQRWPAPGPIGPSV